MRLLDTKTLTLREFVDSRTVPYAILSHTWGDEEVLFHALDDPGSRKLPGFSKIRSCCELARSEGWDYVWIDTCCIDKTSSAELSEAINSMYRWYQDSIVCYVYLVDVSMFAGKKKFRDSRWFTRGWTLQELLAPRSVVFYDKDWVEIGTRSSLLKQISMASGISQKYMLCPLTASAATRMSWASKRETCRVEDMAYSLLGLFGINMPLLYGEGHNAFARLQRKVLKNTGDESLLAWGAEGVFFSTGALAFEPACFVNCGDIVRLDLPTEGPRIESITKQSIIMKVLVMEENRASYVPLECARASRPTFYLALVLLREEDSSYARNHVGRVHIGDVKPLEGQLNSPEFRVQRLNITTQDAKLVQSPTQKHIMPDTISITSSAQGLLDPSCVKMKVGNGETLNVSIGDPTGYPTGLPYNLDLVFATKIRMEMHELDGTSIFFADPDGHWISSHKLKFVDDRASLPLGNGKSLCFAYKPDVSIRWDGTILVIDTRSIKPSEIVS